MKAKWSILICILITAFAMCGFAAAEEIPDPLPAPEFRLAETQAARGELIRAYIGGVEGADYYRMEAVDGEDQVAWFIESSRTGDIWLTTAPLEPGQYAVRAFAVIRSGETDEGGNPIWEVYGEAAEAGSITVAPYAGGERTGIVRLSRTEVDYHGQVLLSAYAPGADYIRLKCKEDPNVNWSGTGDVWSYYVMLSPGTYTLSAEAYYNDGSAVSTNEVTMTVTAPQTTGALGEPETDLTDGRIVPAGENLTVTYSFTGETGLEGLDVVYGWTLFDETEEQEIMVFDTEELQFSGSFTVDGELLRGGRVYKLELYTYAPGSGLEAAFLDRTIIAAKPAADTGNLSLTSDGLTEVSAPSHSEIPLTIHAPGAREVRLIRGREWDWEPFGSDNGFEEDLEASWWSSWKEGTVALYLEATYDDPGDEQAVWISSAPLIVHVTTNGQRLSAPEFTIPAPVEIGSVMEVTVDALDENAKWCWADVHPFRDDGEIDWDFTAAHGDIYNNTIYLNTNRLEPGRNYLVSVACSAPGWLDSANGVRVFTASGEASGNSQFIVINPEVQTGESIMALANVPGAYELRVYVDGNQDDNWGFWGGESMNCDFWVFWESGDHSFTLSARMKEEWESWNDWTDVETVAVHIGADRGELNLSGIPVIWKAGEDWTLDLAETGAARCNFGMWKEGRDDWDWRTEWRDENVITVPGDVLDEGVFHWWLEACGPGYEMTRREGALIVTGSETDANIRLDVPENAVCGEDFRISASAEGASAVGVWIPGWNDRFETGSSLEWMEQIRWEGDITVFARACYDEMDWDNTDWRWFDWNRDVNWGPVSEVKIIHVTAPNGQAGLPAVEGLQENQQVPWGEPVSVTVSGGSNAAWYHVRIYPRDNDEELFFDEIGEDAEGHGGSLTVSTAWMDPGDYRLNIYVAGKPGFAENGMEIPFTLTGKGQCGRSDPVLDTDSAVRGELLKVTVPVAANAVWYDVRLQDENWNEFFYRRYDEPGTFYVPTARQDAGGEYYVRVSTGAPGYFWNDSDTETAQRFTVSQSEDSGISFRIDRTAADTCGEYTISVYAPGTDEILIMENMAEMDHVWESVFTGTYSRSRAGIYEYRALAHYPDGEAGREWVYSDALTVTVGSAETPSLTPEDIGFTMPSVLGADEDLVLSWTDSGLDHYDVNISRTGDWCTVWHSWMRESATSLVIPRIRPNRTDYSVDWMMGPGEPILEAGETYQLDINFEKRGFNSLHISKTFIVEPQSAQDITLTVNGSTADFTIPVNTGTDIVIDAPAGARAILAWGGYDWQWYDADESGDAVLGWSWGDASERLLYAKYTTDEPDGRDWNDYSWSGLSNIVAVTVTADGAAEAPDVEMAGSVPTGTDVRFTVANTEAAGGYNWTVRDPVDGWEWNWEDWRGSAVQTFSTNSFVIGRTYLLKVGSYGRPGLTGTETQVPFLVTGEGVIPAVQATVPETAVRGQALRVTVENAEELLAYDGLQIAAAPFYAPEDRWFGRWYEWDGENTILVPTADLEAGREYKLFIHGGAAGWQESESEYLFTVTEPETGGIQFAIDKTQVDTCEEFTISVYAHDAEEIVIIENMGPMDSVHGEDAYIGTHWRGDPGVYEFGVGVWYRGAEEWTYAEPITVSVGSENTPGIDTAALNLQIPAEVAEGSALEISWSDIGLKHYDITVWQNGSRRIWHSWNYAGETGVSVPAVMPDRIGENAEWLAGFGEEILKAGETCNVEIRFEKAGCRSLTVWRQILVTSGTAQDITLTVNGGTADFTIPVNTDTSAAIDAPDGAKAALLWGGYNWQWYDLDEHGDAETGLSWGDANERILYAKYTAEEPDGRNWENYTWSGLSNVIRVNVTSNGFAPAPEVVMESNVTAGTDAMFTVTNTEISNGFSWTVHDPIDGWEWGWEDWRGDAVQVIGTRGLEIGRTYILRVNSYGQPGLEGTMTEIPFTVTGDGSMPETQADVPPAVERGQFLEVIITNTADLAGFNGLYISAAPYYEPDDMWFGRWYDWDGEGRILLPTADLQAGYEYILYIHAGAAGWQESESEYRFTVTEPEQGGILFMTDKTEADTCEEFMISVYAPGAEEIVILENGWEMERRDGDQYAERHWRSEPGTYEFTAGARYPGTEEWEYAAPVTVTVGSENTPDIDADALGLRIPDELAEGEALEISWNDIGLKHYDVNVRQGNGREVWHSWNRRGETSVTVPAVMPGRVPENADMPLSPGDEILKAGEVYEVAVYFEKTGFRPLRVERQIAVKAAAGQEIILTVNGSTEDFTIPVNTNADAVIDAPEDATVILAWGGYDWQWYDTDENGNAAFGWSWGDPGERLLYAKYTTEIPDERPWDEYNWIGTSNIIRVNATAEGFAPDPIVEMPGSVPVGSEVEFTVDNAGDIGGYSWTVYDPVDEWTWDWADWQGEATQRFSTDGFVPGREYLLVVQGNGLPGLQGDRISVPFTVNDAVLMLTASVNETSYDYAGIVQLTAAVTYPDGSTEGLEEAYPDAYISATLIDANGEAVPGFIVQGAAGFELSCGFPLSDDYMEPGYYRILVEMTAENLTAVTDAFYYTADKSHLPDPSTCQISLEISTTEFKLFERFILAATVTDQEGNPAAGIKVGFQILDLNGEVTDFYNGYSYIWNTTEPETGSCGLASTKSASIITSFPPGQYIARVFIVDADHEIAAEQPFSFSLNELVLPGAIREIEEEAFANTGFEMVRIPEGCESIGEYAFKDCPNLIYVRIPASVTDVPENAFEGCSENLVIDRTQP